MVNNSAGPTAGLSRNAVIGMDATAKLHLFMLLSIFFLYSAINWRFSEKNPFFYPIYLDFPGLDGLTI